MKIDWELLAVVFFCAVMGSIIGKLIVAYYIMPL